ncbi:flippase-like domain-containing protein [Kineosporia sp. J2-2]|uniref:Flippase-like domain-containing protein n=1 Tax=Kineosporia corallincola TaxID=2835133 RepID=A0ABS5TMB2_9ACTN|nr:lysylphosphatidylglycerol synthase transmembrane domain-containing protein [Kineosporia corallincola]MBT0772222.1 flippase-like domain-containing protein [Kineosporia corallincola]
MRPLPAQEAPEPEREPGWGRVIGRVVLVLATVLGGYALLQQVDFADLFERLRSTDPLWLTLACLASVLPIVGSAAGFVAFAPGKLPFGQTTLVQLATSFVNLITPASAGGLALNVRYLTRKGIPLAVAVAVVGLVQTTSVLVTAVLVVLLLVASGRSLSDAPHVPWMTVGAALGVVVALLVLLRFWPWGRALVTKYVVRPFRDAGPELRDIVTDRRRLALAVAGHLTVTLGFVAVLGSALWAFGESAPLVLLAVVVISGSAIAGAVPVPGGIGAAEAALAGGLVVIGVDKPVALSAAVLFRLITFWVRVPIGWLALLVLRRQSAV